MAYRFKIAETENEFEQIFALTHRVFASELGQYGENPARRLIDKFHHKNRYIIASSDDTGEEYVVGMVCIHSEAPFSVADKLADASVLASYGRLIEVRLLAVEPQHRNGQVMAGLMLEVYNNSREFDTIVISGVVQESKMYHRLGFRELGPAVRSGNAWFVPMAVKVADVPAGPERWKKRLVERMAR